MTGNIVLDHFKLEPGELGVIAGDRSFELVHSFVIPGSDDGKVAVERAKVQGMKDFLVVHKTHTFIMNDKNVLQQVEYFFKTGTFCHKTNESMPGPPN